MLRARCQEAREMDSDLRQAQQSRDRCSRVRSGTYRSTTQVAQRFLCRNGLRPRQLLEDLPDRSWRDPDLLLPHPGFGACLFLCIACMYISNVVIQFNAVQLFFTWFSLANLWLTFSIIIDLLPAQGVVIGGNIVVIHWVNQALKWIYLSFLALQFVLALGNRPKGERMAYTVTLWYVFC